ncbi:MAG: hypothetical protein O2897_04265 [bacterium]|nr:hypothetical protein [bacterium]
MKKLSRYAVIIGILLINTSALASTNKNRSICHIKLISKSYAVYIGNFFLDIFKNEVAAKEFVRHLVQFKICKIKPNKPQLPN